MAKKVEPLTWPAFWERYVSLADEFLELVPLIPSTAPRKLRTKILRASGSTQTAYDDIMEHLTKLRNEGEDVVSWMRTAPERAKTKARRRVGTTDKPMPWSR